MVGHDTSQDCRFSLTLQFKGNRNYLQGGDIFNATQEAAQKRFGTDIWLSTIVFRGFASTSCELIIGQTEKFDVDLVRATCTLQHGNNKIAGVVIETGKPVTGRYPFDESRIIQNCVCDGQGIRQKIRTGFSPIEEIIAMTKYLHNRLLPTQSGKWIFSQLDLREPFSNDAQCCYSVTLKQNLANRMTVSEVIQQDRTVGKIRFTVAKL